MTREDHIELQVYNYKKELFVNKGIKAKYILLNQATWNKLVHTSETHLSYIELDRKGVDKFMGLEVLLTTSQDFRLEVL